MKVDLNSDLGESFGHYVLGNDEQILPLITAANVACPVGFMLVIPTLWLKR